MVTPSKRTWSLALMVSAPSWSEGPLLPSEARTVFGPSPEKLCFIGIKVELVNIHPGIHISNARLECMSSCRRFLRVTLEVELSVIGVGVGSHIMCCNCVFKVRRI